MIINLIQLLSNPGMNPFIPIVLYTLPNLPSIIQFVLKIKRIRYRNHESGDKNVLLGQNYSLEVWIYF